MKDKISDIASVMTIMVSVPTLISWFKGNKLLAGILGALCIILLIISTISVLKNKHKSLIYRRIAYLLTPKYNYVLALRDVKYEYRDREHIDHSKFYKIIPKIECFESFTDRYVFSGEPICKVKSTYRNQKIVHEWKDHGWNFFTIELPEPAQRGREVTMGMKMDTIEDINHTAVPFLSTGIYEPTIKLKMEVKFGSGIIPFDPKLRIYKDYVDRHPVDEKPLTFDAEKRIISYEELYPVYHYKYLIAWSFKE